MSSYAMIVVVEADGASAAQEVAARDSDAVLFVGDPWPVAPLDVAGEYDTGVCLDQHSAHEAARSTAVDLASRLNAGASVAAALRAVGLSQDDVYGEDLGGECMDVTDPQNDVIDLGWNDGTHRQVRRLARRGGRGWEVEVMRRFAVDHCP